MHRDDTFLAPATPEAAGEMRRWLLLGVAALAVAGMLALALAMARTPAFSHIPWLMHLFHVALVVHVDLSVLVWFLAVACMMWSWLWSSSGVSFTVRVPYLRPAAFWLMAAGTALMALSPLYPEGEPIMSNYIPMLTNPPFFFGLALVFCGVLLAAVAMLLLVLPWMKRQVHSFSEIEMLQLGIYSSAIITVLALVAFAASSLGIPAALKGEMFYETLFWGGGHILQFTHTQLMVVAWLALAAAAGWGHGLSAKTLSVLFSVGVVAAFAGLAAYPLYHVTSYEHLRHFTVLMIVAGGIAPGILGVALLHGFYRARPLHRAMQRPAYWGLWCSLALFAYGGVLGGLIRGQNVGIPAHYHGSIVGVTLAFMALALLLLPKLGGVAVNDWKSARFQPVIYALGQATHISALAYSGGYEMLRKTPGGFENAPASLKAAMGMMGLGGVLSILGGFMFVVVVVRSLWLGAAAARGLDAR